MGERFWERLCGALRNPEILAEKILYLVKNEDERKKMSENNRKLIEEKNNYYKEMEKMEEIYRGLTKKWERLK